jgi:IS5 family transposase
MIKKPRDYRENAHRVFIAFTKKRRPGPKVIKEVLRKQLNYLKRNIAYLEDLIPKVEFQIIPKTMLQELFIIKELFNQQRDLFVTGLKKVSHRIVSLSQPHIRPIVRGKAGKSVEFGAKISISLVDGFSFIDRLSWENFNEGTILIDQIEIYHKRFGYYPESVHGDKIYQNRVNRNYCKERNIRITGKALGRPAKITPENMEAEKQKRLQRYQDDIDRIAVEGRFGVAKRKYGLGLIKSKLLETSETEIYMSILVLNLDKICNAELKEKKEKYKIRKKKAS